jgi:hypothetical protein
MSNLSDIGFPTPDEQAVNEMIMHVLELAKPIQTQRGFYLKFSDESGAEIYLQGNFEQELIGFNPHFAGKSRRKVGLTKVIERDSSELDGGFYAWANPSNQDVETSGDYPFVFDVPDFRTVLVNEFPFVSDIQLTAFGSNDFQIFADEKVFLDNSDSNLAAKSFIPSGLFLPDEEMTEIAPPRPIGIFAGEILEFELRTNTLSGEKFYWFLIETYGGEADVVIDPKYVAETPQIGGIITGTFWLSGKFWSDFT